MALEGFADAIQKATIETDSPAARQGAEQALRVVVRQARDMADSLRAQAQGAGPPEGATRGA
jgi:hypothetical protein